MKIITISREFGSGGRELGKRLADVLQIPCYDHEIIELIAEKQQLDKDYVARISERDIGKFYLTTISHRFAMSRTVSQQSVNISVTETNVIKELAARGDCVIVGRCADIILREMKPMNLFVYADTRSKIDRCMARAHEGENLTQKEIVKKMRKIDKSRMSYRSLFIGDKEKARETFHLCVNTSGREIKLLVPAVAEYIRAWFKQS